MSLNPSEIARGNAKGLWVIAPSLTPAIVAPNTSAEQTFTVKGLRLGDYVGVNKPTTQAGLAIVGSRVSAADTLAITFGNLTSATITPTAAQTYTVQVARPVNIDSNVSNLASIPVA